MTQKDHSTTNPYNKGQKVRLVPQDGCYQKVVYGEVTSVTATLVGVKRPDKMGEVRYRVSDGLAFNKYDQQQFPKFRLMPMPEDGQTAI